MYTDIAFVYKTQFIADCEDVKCSSVLTELVKFLPTSLLANTSIAMAEALVPSVPLTSILDPGFDASKITKEVLDLSYISEPDKLAFLLHNVFTPEKCENLIKTSEQTGYSEALVHVGGGRQILMKGYREGSRVMIDDRAFVGRLLDRIATHLPATFQNEHLLEINERLRFLRYDEGDQFQPHCDASYGRPDNTARTLITLQIYLNESFKGGETTFLPRGRDRTTKCLPVVPKTGMILVFEHNILHEGSLVKRGRKYTIRTDVLYTMKK